MTNLPENWIRCKLDVVCNIYQPKTISTRCFIESGGYIVYGANGKIGRYNKYNHIDSEVLITCRGATCGRINISQPFSWINGNAMVVKPYCDNLNKNFLYYYLNSINFAPYISGSAQPQITRISLRPLNISIPPLAEQGRIVAKIEELFAGIDAGVENLKSVKNQIALYRQSVLKSAFDFDKSIFLPLKILIEKVRYGTSKKCSMKQKEDSMHVYRIPNIDFEKGILDKTDLKFASFDDSEKSSLMLKSGDILIIRSNGSLNLVGRAALVSNTDTNGLYAGYLMRLRVKDTENLLPKFLLNFLNSGMARAYIEEKAKSTSGVNNINSEEISDLQIPVPTLVEQERIVAEIESRFERADALEAAVDRALSDAEKLKQAVLKKAFSGELVPQNPDDEPASVLLDRIRAARSSEQPARKKKLKR